jgi:hypothetical protein
MRGSLAATGTVQKVRPDLMANPSGCGESKMPDRFASIERDATLLAPRASRSVHRVLRRI